MHPAILLQQDAGIFLFYNETDPITFATGDGVGPWKAKPQNLAIQ